MYSKEKKFNFQNHFLGEKKERRELSQDHQEKRGGREMKTQEWEECNNI
jgi:hypothetical protein